MFLSFPPPPPGSRDLSHWIGVEISCRLPVRICQTVAYEPQMRKTHILAKMRNMRSAIWSRMVRFSRRDLCSRSIS